MVAFRLSESDPSAVPGLAGTLERGAEALPVRLTPASRLSLRVTFADGAVAKDGDLFSALVVEGRELPVRLGACRFLADGAGRASGRLVFTAGMYDCQKLVEDRQVVDLRRSFDDLSLVLSQRDRIRPEFRDYVADLQYDISVHRRYFDEQDRILAQEPEASAEAAREVLIATDGRRFIEFLERKARELETLVASYTKEEHERHGFYMRRQVWPYILASEFLKRTNLKPSGYAGDAEIMVMLYDNVYVGNGTFARLMHKQPVETRAADAVRSRRRLVPRVLRDVAARFDGGRHAFRFFSIACGPAYELRDVFVEPEDFDRFECALLDQDPHALTLARGCVRRLEMQHGRSLAATYFQDSVRTMLRTRDLKSRFGEHQFVYSMGLFDYLTPPVARAVLAKAYELVAPGGTLLIGNYHIASPTRVYMDYWADWPLYYRTEDAFMDLADGLAARSKVIDFDETRCQMFLRIEKDG